MKRIILIAAIVIVMAAITVVPATAQGAPGAWNTGVFDRGPRPHAMGTTWGNLYYVVRGDTLFSIGLRFGLYWPVIAQANGISSPPTTQAGQCLIIPGLGAMPPQPIPPRPIPPPPHPPAPWPPPPMPTPIPPPTQTPIPPATSAIRIDIPLPGAILPATFIVSGRGRNLFEGNVVVRAYNAQRVLLAEKATVLQGPNVGTGGEGAWSVQLTVNTPPGTQGVIEASSPQPTPAMAAVTVVFGSGSSGSVIYPPGRCQIQAAVGKPIYNAPNGQVIGSFASNGWFNALERQTVSGMNWYKIQPGGSATPPAWAPTPSLTSVGTGC